MTQSLYGSFIDGDINGGMSGADVHVIETTLTKADVSGLAEHSANGLCIVTVAGLIDTSTGAINLFYHYDHIGT